MTTSGPTNAEPTMPDSAADTPSDDGATPGAAAPVPAPRGIRPIWLVLQFLVMVGAAITLWVVVHDNGSTRQAKVYEFTVPMGTAAAIDAGKNVDVFPARLDVRVGDQLVIHNHDNRVAQVGPYLVNRDETLAQTFTEPGTIVGVCTIHPSGKVTIEIRA